MKRSLNRLDTVSRRGFVAGVAAGFLGVGSIPLFQNAATAAELTPEKFPLGPATAKNVIYLYMAGGITHLDTFDTKPGAETQGPTESIPTNADGVLVSEHFPNMAQHMDKVCVMNSITSNQGAHAQARYYMHTSYPMRGTIRHPSMGAWLARMGGNTNPNLPAHVLIGGGSFGASAGFFESKYSPLPIGDPEAGLKNAKRAAGVNGPTFDRRLARLKNVNKSFAARYDQKQVRAYTDMYDDAVNLMGSNDLETFNLSKEPAALRDAYGRNRFGQGCLLARRLVENDVRFVEVTLGGWDTHSANFDQMKTKCPPLDQALAALLADLEVRGLLEETLVVLATEFGRTPNFNAGNLGRNHYPKAFTCLLAGGGVQGGQKYGKTDDEGREVVENPVKVTDFNATIAYALGLPVEHIVMSPSHRPFQVAHKGKPVTAVF